MKTTLALAAAAAFWASAAGATEPGPYASLGAGVSIPSNSTPNISVLASTPRQIDTSFKAGWAVRGAAGYAFSMGYRTELEVGYRQASLGHINEAVATGKQGSFDVMGNLLINVGSGFGFQPYIGGGVGAAWTKWQNVQGGASVALGGPTAVYNDSSPAVFQYQGIAGVSFALKPNSELFFDYRYIGTTSHTFQSTSPVGFTLSEHKDASHNLIAGIRFSFGGK